MEEKPYKLSVFMDDKRVLVIGSFKNYDDALKEALENMEDPRTKGYRIEPIKFKWWRNEKVAFRYMD
ncbi:TPA: transporter [Escherichia coli]|nr:transporter [Escherichia coli]HAZ3913886.1 transporter [Escherichia coli]